jgi:AcrR family transcriptional regulator
MPKVVDHDAQRVKFAEAAMSLIAQHGLEGVTMRAVAAKAGLSYGSLFHYFTSKDELLMHVVQHSSELQTRRVNEFTSRHSGLRALEHLLCDDAIITESTREDWMVWVTFLYKAAMQESFAEMHAEMIDGWLARISGLLQDAQDAGEISATVDVDFEAKAIWAYSAGIGQLSLLHSSMLPVDVQKRLISAYLEKLVSP